MQYRFCYNLYSICYYNVLFCVYQAASEMYFYIKVNFKLSVNKTRGHPIIHFAHYKIIEKIYNTVLYYLRK